MSNTGFLQRIGTLRLTLLIATLICYPLVLTADMEPEGLGMLAAYVAPSMVVIFFFLLMLDALMNRVFMVDAQGAERQEKRLRMWVDLAVVAGLVITWSGYFRSIGEL